MSEEYSADFTTPDNNHPVICGRDACKKKVFPPGTKLNFLHSNSSEHAGRDVCDSCYEYYLSKTTTQRRETVRETWDHAGELFFNNNHKALSFFVT